MMNEFLIHNTTQKSTALAVLFLSVYIFFRFIKENIHFLIRANGYANVIIYPRQVEIADKHLLRFQPFKIISHISLIVGGENEIRL